MIVFFEWVHRRKQFSTGGAVIIALGRAAAAFLWFDWLGSGGGWGGLGGRIRNLFVNKELPWLRVAGQGLCCVLDRYQY